MLDFLIHWFVFILTNSTEPCSLCCRWFWEVYHCKWQAGPWTSKPMGCHQRWGWEPLRIRLLAKLLAPNAPPGSHRDHFADPLRDLPCQAIVGAQGEQRTRPRKQTDQSRRRPRNEPELSTHDHEWLLRPHFFYVCFLRGVPLVHRLSRPGERSLIYPLTTIKTSRSPMIGERHGRGDLF